MVEFGKTLNEVVKRDWRCHAVAYIELKRCLSGDDKQPKNRNVTDDHSVHTESSFKVTDEQKDEFFRIYEDSILRLFNFYNDRVSWSEAEKNALEIAVEKRVNRAAETEEEDSSSSLSFLIHRITDYIRDLGLIQEFLDLNATAFSKILKKFDKRTGSILRESKLKELKAQHPYLYDGGEVKVHKNIAEEWCNQLETLLQKGTTTTLGHRRKKSQGSLKLSLRNSFIDEEGLNLKDLAHQSYAEEDGLKVEDIKRHDSSSKTERTDNTKKREGSVRFKVGTKAPQHDRVTKQKRPSSSVHKTKDSQILVKMIERVDEELCLQQAESPFFDEAMKLNPPPSFTNAEVEMAKVLGKGEFCQIFEVRKFNVPESCHICFLHRGFNDPKMPSEGGERSLSPVPSSKPHHNKVPSSVILNIADILKEEDGEGDELQLAAVPTRSESPQQQRPSMFGPFEIDENISDYDELESDHEDDAYDQNNTRGFMKDHCLRNGEARYAVKRIRHDLVGEEEITDAAIDLAREGQFLAGLSHPNIIKIRGTSNVPGHPKYCLILDRLYDTLEVQMLKWKEEVKRYQGKFKGLIGKKKEELNKIWMARLLAAYDLAHAMSYLHKRGILHRDIKPANIGFDIRGDIKIFDFGLAKELKPSEREGHDQYKSSGLAGTRRYMAPEVAEISPYGFSADVYSFAILLWEMLTLKTAFEKYSRERHYREIIVEGKRPKLPRSWPFVIKNLVQRCWAPIPSDRPSFQSVCEKIKFGFPDHTLRSDHSADSLMRRSVKSISGHRETWKPSEVAGVGIKNDQSNSDSQSGSLSASIRVRCDSLSDSLSTSVHIRMKTGTVNGKSTQ